MKFPDVVKANIEILKKAGIKFSTNLEKKVCCGAPAFNIRDHSLVNDFIKKNKELIESTGAKIVVSDCPGCVLTLTQRYSKVGSDIDIKVIHIVEYFKELLKNGKLKFQKSIPEDLRKITIHDPCLMARNLKDITSIRDILKTIKDVEIIEPTYNKEYTHCCGWSGTAHWADQNIAIKEAKDRVKELKETDTTVFLTACPLCELGLAYGIDENEKQKYKILDLSELLIKVL